MRILIIGGGRIALSHIPQLLSYSHIDIVGVVDRSVKSRLTISQLFKIKTFKDVPNIDFDAVFILTPPQHHFEYITSFLRKNIPVFCEKPVSINSQEAQEIQRICQSNNVFFQGGYVYRHSPTFQFLKEIIRNTKKLSDFSISFNGYVHTETGSWRGNNKFGSILYEYGSHAIDLLVYLTSGQLSFNPQNQLTQLSDPDKKTIFFSSNQVLNGDVQCNLDWKNTELRKASMEILCNCDDALFKVSDTLIIRNGENITVNSTSTDCDFYLRGENFSLQAQFFCEHYNTGYQAHAYEAHSEVLLDQVGEHCT